METLSMYDGKYKTLTTVKLGQYLRIIQKNDCGAVEAVALTLEEAK